MTAGTVAQAEEQRLVVLSACQRLLPVLAQAVVVLAFCSCIVCSEWDCAFIAVAPNWRVWCSKTF